MDVKLGWMEKRNQKIKLKVVTQGSFQNALTIWRYSEYQKACTRRVRGFTRQTRDNMNYLNTGGYHVDAKDTIYSGVSSSAILTTVTDLLSSGEIGFYCRPYIICSTVLVTFCFVNYHGRRD